MPGVARTAFRVATIELDYSASSAQVVGQDVVDAGARASHLPHRDAPAFSVVVFGLFTGGQVLLVVVADVDRTGSVDRLLDQLAVAVPSRSSPSSEAKGSGQAPT